MTSGNDKIAIGMVAATGELIIQSKFPRAIGEMLPLHKPEDKIRLIVAEESTEAEYRKQHEVDLGQDENQHMPGWNYFYRVEAAD